MRLLILGGTTEASRLAQAIATRANVAPVLSLAGRTLHPAAAPVPLRVGGFGGSEGLARYLLADRIHAVIDATHPFAPRISANAVAACATTGRPLAVFTRPAWTRQAGDDWTSVDSLEAAALALGRFPRRVFLTAGRLGLSTFRAAAGHHYLLRTIDPPAPADLPPRHTLILARGPFRVADEIRLMQEERIDVLVTKNSGGQASFAKIEAARSLGLPVVMVERLATPAGLILPDLEAALAWIEAQRPPP